MNKGAYELDYWHIFCGTGSIPTATIRLKRNKDNKILRESSTGDGPIDAAFKSINRITKVRGRLIKFSLNAVSKGQDASGEASISVKFCCGKPISNVGISTDIIEASIQAYLKCINDYLIIRKRKQSV